MKNEQVALGALPALILLKRTEVKKGLIREKNISPLRTIGGPDKPSFGGGSNNSVEGVGQGGGD